MSHFVIEHLPRVAAHYRVEPLDYKQAVSWLSRRNLTSLVRTTELISAIQAGTGLTLTQADDLMRLAPGDEALLIGLSFGVLLAWAEGKIPPLEEDWRCLSVRVEQPPSELLALEGEMAISSEMPITETMIKPRQPSEE